MAQHALLGPSGAHRWLRCTPSAVLELNFPDNADAAAAEGTLAHRLCELLIRYRLGQVNKALYKKELSDIQSNVLYETSMYDHCDGYAVYVLERYAEAQTTTPGAIIKLEQMFDLTQFIPEGFGTGDCSIIADDVLDVTDFKYGKGVAVSAHENEQLMLYGLGALIAFGFLFDIRTVRMTIYQPRLNSITHYELPAEELIRWGKTFVLPRAKKAFDGKGEYVAGEHCMFCRAKAMCKANAEYNLEIAKYDFVKAQLLNDDDVADILKIADNVSNWLTAVKDYAYAQALSGKKWPGFKLVEGRSNRVFTDDTKVADTIIKAGYDEEDVYNVKLKGMGDLEKLLGKNKFEKLLNPLIIKPAGKPTLTSSDDERIELQSEDDARNSFKHLLLTN